MNNIRVERTLTYLGAKACFKIFPISLLEKIEYHKAHNCVSNVWPEIKSHLEEDGFNVPHLVKLANRILIC